MSLAYLVGVMLGDGGVYGNTYTVFCRDGDKRFVQWCAERVREIFGIQPRIHKAAPNCWAGFINRTHPFGLAVNYVFIKQSAPPGHCDLPSAWQAPLRPKARGQFADFPSLGSPGTP